MASITHQQSTIDIARLGAPIAVRGLSYAALGVIDTAFSASLGVAALAGVGLAGTLTFTALVPVVAYLTAIKVCVAQRRGEGSDPLRATAMGLRFAAYTAPLGMLALGLAASATGHLLASPEAQAAASAYLLVRVLGVPVDFLTVALREHLYGMGNSVTPMRAALLSMLVNVALNLLAITALDQGAWALAAATVIARGVAAVYLSMSVADAGGLAGLLKLARLLPKDERLAVVRELRGVGLPFAAQRLCESGAFAFISTMVARQSDADAATHELAIRILMIGVLPCHAIGDAVAVLGGEAHRRGDETVRARLLKAGVGLALPWTISACAVAWWVAPVMLRAIGVGDEAAASAEILGPLIWALRLAGLLLLFEGSSVVAQGILRATGEPRFASLVVGTNATVLSPAVTALGVVVLGLGAEAAWGAFCLEVILTNILLLGRVRRSERDRVEAPLTC